MTARTAYLGALFVLATVCANGETLILPLPEIPSSTLLEGMPSFQQRNIEFPDGGKRFCGPTAASNALMWLADRGYPALKPSAENDSIAQQEMIKRLAERMGTYREGTSLTSFQCGVNTYLRSAGYAPKSWVFSGNGCTIPGLPPPDPTLVRSLSGGKTVMWFSLGWYCLDASSRKYTRDFGHWVTLVGYGKNREGMTDPDCFVIADPESPDGHKYITLKMLTEGLLSNGSSRVDAKGYFNLVELNLRPADKSPKYCLLESIQALTIE
jgi:hypothetical protein